MTDSPKRLRGRRGADTGETGLGPASSTGAKEVRKPAERSGEDRGEAAALNGGA